MEKKREAEWSGPFRYADILHLPYHRSLKRARMSLEDRAVQFAPFAALTGYEDAVREESRYTVCRKELSDEEVQSLNERWLYLQALLYRAIQKGEELPRIELTYFVPYVHENEGNYRTEEVVIVRIDPLVGEVRLKDGRRIPIRDVSDLTEMVFED